MKKADKTKITKEKILTSAIEEFGIHSYDGASINTICEKNKISKGLIYHNFKNKDDLYLQCVTICFQEMKCCMDRQVQQIMEQLTIQDLMTIRQKFLEENPYFSNIFFNVVLQPPKHLLKQIKDIRKDFDGFYINQIKKIIGKMPLRNDIDLDTAIEYIVVFSEMYNGYFRNKADETGDFKEYIFSHEVVLCQDFGQPKRENPSLLMC